MELNLINGLTENYHLLLIGGAIITLIFALYYAGNGFKKPSKFFCVKCEAEKRPDRFGIKFPPRYGICFTCLAHNFTYYALQQVKNSTEMKSPKEIIDALEKAEKK